MLTADFPKKTMMIFEHFVKYYGDTAYDKAVEFTVVSVQMGDLKGAKLFSDIAKELIKQGKGK